MPAQRTKRASIWLVALAGICIVSAMAVSSAISAAATSPAVVTKDAKRWSGTGNRSLGTVKLARTSVVRWTVTGKRFALTDTAKKLKISGKARTGQSFAARRTYHGVRVTAKGRWTLTITPLAPPKPKKK